MTTNMYCMPKVRVVALFQNALGAGFGTEGGTITSGLPIVSKWEGDNGFGGVHRQFNDHISSMQTQIVASIKRMKNIEARELACLCLQLLVGFLLAFKGFIHCWY